MSIEIDIWMYFTQRRQKKGLFDFTKMCENFGEMGLSRLEHNYRVTIQSVSWAIMMRGRDSTTPYQIFCARFCTILPSTFCQWLKGPDSKSC